MWSDTLRTLISNINNYSYNIPPINISKIINLNYIDDMTLPKVNDLYNIKVKMISSSYNHCMILSDNGDLYLWGNNTSGVLGSTKPYFKYPTINNFFKDFNIKLEYITTNFKNSYGIDNNGNLYSWGKNVFGELGIDKTNTLSNTTPTKIDRSYFNNHNIRCISHGNNSCLALDDEYNIYTWGNNDRGQLGNDTTTKSSTPVNITYNIQTNYKIIQICSTYNNTHAVLDSKYGYDENGTFLGGEIFVWGNNTDGTLGNDTIDNYSTSPINISNYGSLKNNKIIKIVGGNNFIVALDSNGYVHTWGKGDFGQLGYEIYSKNNIAPIYSSLIPTKLNINNIADINISGYNVYAKDFNNKVYIWGDNMYGQLCNYKLGSKYDSPVLLNFN